MLLAAVSRRRFAWLAQEDGPIEWATFFAFVVAGAVAARHALRRGVPRIDRVACALVAAFTVFVAGEEISWGERLFSFQPPALFLRSNFQQESNLHNLLKGVFDSRWQVTIIALGYGVALPLLARRWGSVWRALAPWILLAPWAAIVAGLEIVYATPLVGELAELLLGLLFVRDALERATRRDPAAERPSLRPFVALAVVLGLGAVTPSVLDATIYRPSRERVDAANAEVRAIGAALENKGLTRRVVARRSIHKRLYTAKDAGYVVDLPRWVVGESDADARRETYLLDPWNQPYWIRTKTEAGAVHVLVYSFGPNRRRDSLFDEVSEDGDPMTSGDDVGMSFVVER